MKICFSVGAHSVNHSTIMEMGKNPKKLKEKENVLCVQKI